MSEPNDKQRDDAPFDQETYRADLAVAVDVAFYENPPAPDVKKRLIEFGVLLADRARLFNLTRLTSPKEMAVLHFLDTFHLSRVLDPSSGTVCDIGTGAGVPGIPLAIFRPDLQVTMIDGKAKKARFVAECIATLGLKNARALHERAEEHLRKNRYGAGVLRAAVKPVRMMEILSETRSPLELVVFMLGGDGDAIARTIKSSRYNPALLERYTLPGQRKERFLAGFQLKKKRRRNWH
ncbi:MAG: 16S rRNA (guanine(527)-N(7))-methyltransferase RsmG [Pirellulales bacterium]|nr:16S rRNA (guanine(527)-N(7))-methyltransferase RsmG [Pirellulales bacterium]